MMYTELYDFLEDAMLNRRKVKFTQLNGDSFIAIPYNPSFMSSGDEDDDEWGCSLWEVEGYPYQIIFFKDIASVRRLDDPMKIVYAHKAKAA